MAKVFIVEDDSGILLSLSKYLQGSGFEVVLCDNGSHAYGVFSATLPDIVILDINLPGQDGKSLITQFFSRKRVPIIMLTARIAEQDIIDCFELGAIDYVRKPFSSRELVSRIRAHIASPQKQETKLSESHSYFFDGLELRTDSFEVILHGKSIETTKTEFSLLLELFRDPTKLISREFLMKQVMGYEHYIYDRTIDTHMKNIRKKIEGGPTIETVRGVGYKVLPRTGK